MFKQISVIDILIDFCEISIGWMPRLWMITIQRLFWTNNGHDLIHRVIRQRRVSPPTGLRQNDCNYTTWPAPIMFYGVIHWSKFNVWIICSIHPSVCLSSGFPYYCTRILTEIHPFYISYHTTSDQRQSIYRYTLVIGVQPCARSDIAAITHPLWIVLL